MSCTYIIYDLPHFISAEIILIKMKLITPEVIQTISHNARESQLYSMSNDVKME